MTIPVDRTENTTEVTPKDPNHNKIKNFMMIKSIEEQSIVEQEAMTMAGLLFAGLRKTLEEFKQRVEDLEPGHVFSGLNPWEMASHERQVVEKMYIFFDMKDEWENVVVKELKPLYNKKKRKKKEKKDENKNGDGEQQQQHGVLDREPKPGSEDAS